MDVYNIVSASHFANKIWNLAKFTFGRLDALTAEEAEQLKCLLQKPPHIDQDTPLVNRYLLSRLARTTRAVNVSLQAWRIHEAATEMRRFLVEDLCDTYIEYTKPVLNSNETNVS
jgi:valyl-tRNA synthetase